MRLSITLSGGQQQMVAVGMALMPSPRLMMKSGRVVLEKPAAELLAAQDSWWELY